ncbi:DUF1403 family protein [Mesorhizobium sp. WSM2561]|uniref:DUF1403 family protein n=1 Tax=Mesorhizobium sp. WSM2561 TaxID=1040985 RepID=UPI00048568C9
MGHRVGHDSSPESARTPRGKLPGTTPAAPVVVPGWLRRAVPDAQSLVAKSFEDVAIAAGAAIGSLDALVAPARALGRRLAAAAGARCSRSSGAGGCARRR